jgi:predicted MFS family arabinose efflux permease
MRAAATQFGYLFGAVLGGVALAAWGYPGMGVTFAGLFVLAAIPHGIGLLAQRRPQPMDERVPGSHPGAGTSL